MTNNYTQACLDLPNFPADVMDIWLRSEIEKKGWPPSPMNDWKYLQKKIKSIQYLQNLRWNLQEIELLNIKIMQEDVETIQLVLGNGYGSKHRIDSVLQYFETKPIFPKPIILEKIADGYSLLDGNHRFAAFLIAMENNKHTNKFVQVSLKQPAWIATKMDA